ncbi:DNA polymerase delta subunit 4 isoform X3 [Dasypus novemcinctus]|uniref:DNA polymerase delta subunit 4 isoform X3 n=1 Tax=Dasypus novemcinctus TaxID=9361 RepID=UPI000C85FCDB|nr:DNA polymerase delta subunit 4 isoform X3 [Dasypus novemcinctus]
MGRKRLITDSYPVVKRREGPAGHSKGELAPELEEEPQAPDVDEADLELLRQFDLAWQYGPCTALFLGLRSVEAPKTHPYTFSSLGSSSTPKRPQCHLPTLQVSPGCSAGIGHNRWAWILLQRCIRCYRPTLGIPASSAASGISIHFEAPPRTSCLWQTC